MFDFRLSKDFDERFDFLFQLRITAFIQARSPKIRRFIINLGTILKNQNHINTRYSIISNFNKLILKI